MYGDPRDLHVLTHSFPTRRSSDPPQAIAEHSVPLMLSLNRKIHRAYALVREGNFSLEGLLGFDMRVRAVGIVGTGQIVMAVAGILSGFGCLLLAYDRSEEHTSELQSLMRISYAVFFLKRINLDKQKHI